jgi:hypothetical protein
MKRIDKLNKMIEEWLKMIINTTELYSLKKQCKQWTGGLMAGYIEFTTKDDREGIITINTVKKKSNNYNNSGIHNNIVDNYTVKYFN